MTAAKVENGSNVRRGRLGTVVGPHGQSQGRSSMSTDRSRKLEQDLGSFTMITGACASSFFPCVLLFYGKKNGRWEGWRREFDEHDFGPVWQGSMSAGWSSAKRMFLL